MDRRTFLTCAAGTAVALCAAGAGTPARPLFEWSRPGGFFAPGRGVLQPPPLVVYDDGTAYADAAASLRLPAADVRDLRREAVRALATAVDTSRPDQPFDLVRVRAGAGHLSARLGAGPVLAHPSAVQSLWSRVQSLRARALRGEIWRPPAVLLATVRLDFTPAESTPWPLPAPPDLLYGEQLLRGEAARAVQRLVPPAREPEWPRYRVGPGAYIAATWRYLLPHE
ncbi:hypothetical protein Ade02nite_93760 [Paractinoplanes deccanensis]|uniref:Uncharacterized protein n=1 Tax=Paractinoplanes deccanensis TaxID=113561 RepID=A0ABQ3YL58_9ACTN|nr:hypothetical protein [Actinoplanes deccanensis]GID80735.1 hypothetical protein Ade02nite_93760 [Actinoplanes deccanensis]